MDKRELNNLLVSVGKGDNIAFEKLYTETKKGVFALLYPYFNNILDTEDVLQEVYMHVKDKAYLYKNGTDARAWLFQLAKNYALNQLRSKKTETIKLEEIARVKSNEKEKKLDGTLFILMQQVLDEIEYQIVTMHVLMFYKHKDIAKELMMPLGTVLYKYQVALNKLRKELE